MDLRVMAFNIEWGGTHVSFHKVVEAIRRADPDIVAVQEAEGNLERLAVALGWHHDRRNHVISRHRLIDPPGADGRYILVEVEPGKVVAVANVHLPSDPYGEYWIRDGHSVEEVIAMERRVRLPAIQPFLEVLPQLVKKGMPVFLAGDFNSPSHDDWGRQTIDRWPYRRYSVEWPVAKAIQAAGFRDSYRQRHPDPLQQPGFTWWAGRPAIPDYNPGPPEDWQSRIDFVWYAGAVTVTGSTLVGESGAADVSIEIDPWPSDHRAVLSDFAVEAAPMPLLVAAGKRSFRRGEPVSLIYSNRTIAGSLLIVPPSGNGAGSRRIGLDKRRDTLHLTEPPPSTGRYRVVLAGSRGETVSQNEFWILPEDAKAVIETTSKGFVLGEPLSLAWGNAPGNRYDWLVIYPENHAEKGDYLAWAHIGARIEGRITLDARSAVAEWPLPPGRYIAALLADDGFKRLAQSEPFIIHAAEANSE
ncbi:MAG: endonuclease/exonuclease/phosphatase family protein [Woeseia sp.]